MKTFKYKKAIKIIHWGCSFDSLLELRFAISIQSEYKFLRSRISIYYDPTTKRPTNYIRTCTKRYTPDFLIRHNRTGEAIWIEVKPRAFNDAKQMALKKEIAGNYIATKNYDWKFKFIFDDEIMLNQEEQKQFDEISKLRSQSAFKMRLSELNSQFDRSSPLLFLTPPSSSLIHFVMFGTKPRAINILTPCFKSEFGKTSHNSIE